MSMKKRILLMLFLFLFVFSGNVFATEQTSIRDYLMRILEGLNSNFNKATVVDTISGSCGSANNQFFSSRPTSNLCMTGTPVVCDLNNPHNCSNNQLTSLVQGTSLWLWRCVGLNEGASSDCSASKEYVNGDCGSAHNTTVSAMPTANLCATGTPSVVSGSGPWYWTCMGTYTAQQCQANFSSKTIKLLSPNGGETFYWGEVYDIIWESSGVEKINISLQFEDSGGMGIIQNIPASSGKFSWNVDIKASTKHKIIISDANDGNIVDKSDNYFNIFKQSGLINGVCGPLHGTSLSIVQRTNKEFCSSGHPGEIAPSGSWTCYGENGGVNVNCSIQDNMINGSCGSANGSRFLNKPISNLCEIGMASTVSGSGPWTWTCSGHNGGTVASCSALKANSLNTTNIQILAPTAGELIKAGRNYQIKWLADGKDLLNIALAKDNEEWHLAYSVSAEKGMYEWQVQLSNTLTAGDNYRIHIWSNQNTNINTYSNYFSISPLSNVCDIQHVSECTNEQLVNLLKNIMVINGSCGSAHNTTVSAMPTANLCATGTPSVVSGSGPWHWTCNGQNGGKNVNCLAKKINKLNDFNFEKPLDQMNKQELINFLIMILQILQNK